MLLCQKRIAEKPARTKSRPEKQERKVPSCASPPRHGNCAPCRAAVVLSLPQKEVGGAQCGPLPHAEAPMPRGPGTLAEVRLSACAGDNEVTPARPALSIRFAGAALNRRAQQQVHCAPRRRQLCQQSEACVKRGPRDQRSECRRTRRGGGVVAQGQDACALPRPHSGAAGLGAGSRAAAAAASARSQAQGTRGRRG